MKLYTVILLDRKTGQELKAMLDLAPMNHAAACNFMEACRNEHRDYKLQEWPEDVSPVSPPMYSMAYRRDGSPIPFEEALECKEALDAVNAAAGQRMRAYPRGNMGLTSDAAKATPEWKADRRAFDQSMKALQDFNTAFLKHYKREWRAELDRRKAARLPA